MRNIDDLDEITSMLGNDYYKERKKWKDLKFGSKTSKRFRTWLDDDDEEDDD